MDYQQILRRLAIGAPSVLEDLRADQASNKVASGLGPKSAALACLAASVAVGTSPSGYQSHVDDAFAAGATIEEIVGVLIAIAQTVGTARIMLAAPPLALAAGYDTDAALERLDSDYASIHR